MLGIRSGKNVDIRGFWKFDLRIVTIVEDNFIWGSKRVNLMEVGRFERTEFQDDFPQRSRPALP